MRISPRLNSLLAALALVIAVAIASINASGAEEGPDFLVLDPRGE
jgi:hypothetical protein